MRSLAAPSRLVAALVLAAAAIAVACAPATPAGSTATAGGASGSPALTVTDAWVRAAPAGGTSAAYFQLSNGGSADAVVTGATSEVAEAASVHETSTDSGGMTGMHHVPAVTVEAGATLPFEPGGYHVMLERLTADLAAGSTVTITLELEGGATLDVTAEVRAG
jgi:copper(I)-binding protein